MKKLNVLLSAYACVPGRGSEPGVGWNFALTTSKYHNVWVVTQADKRPFIEKELQSGSYDNLHFIYYDLPFWKIKLLPNGIQVYYYLWHVFAARHVKKWCSEYDIDVVHHITMVRYWSPCMMRSSPVPFVWGPVGGGESTPPGLIGSMPWKERLKEKVRKLVQIAAHLDPFVRKTVRAADLCLVTTAQSRERVISIRKRECMEYSESGLLKEEVEALSTADAAPISTLRFISMGRLLSWKGFHLGLHAFAEAAIPNSEYWVCGDGPRRAYLEGLAKSLGIADRVRFFGRLQRSEALERLNESHVLVHPSLHDSGGWVCLEAMASRRPVICLDWGGPGVQVTDEAGMKVVPGSESETVEGIKEAMLRFGKDRALVGCMGEASLEHIRKNYIWDSKVIQYTDRYMELLNNGK
ncbi:MAG: glycosyl transferase family 1 [Puniceicoccaceae bacterium]|nr:glycosyl transferase family 1 [Puniceicoccaceae bacterium]|tara:strand:- start:129 stop:1358 length:1230 start_codon:yes stop_codon:yes gene_type:complete